MVWVKIKSWLIVALGGEPLVRFKTVERELCGMGYSRREAKKSFTTIEPLPNNVKHAETHFK